MLKRPALDTVTSRTLLVLIVGLGVSHVLSVAMYSTDRTSVVDHSGAEHIGDHVATIDRLVSGAPPEERERIVALADGPTLRVVLSAQPEVNEARQSNGGLNVFRNALRRRLLNGDERDVRLQATDEYPRAPGFPHLTDAKRPKTSPAKEAQRVLHRIRIDDIEDAGPNRFVQQRSP